MSLFDKIKEKLSHEFIDIIEWLDYTDDTICHRFERYQNEIKNEPEQRHATRHLEHQAPGLRCLQNPAADDHAHNTRYGTRHIGNADQRARVFGSNVHMIDPEAASHERV